MSSPCDLDNKSTFEQERFYTKYCEVCKLWVKVYKLRTCETRYKTLEKQGIDLLQQAYELEQLAGGEAKDVNNPSTLNQSKKKQTTRRGR